MLNHQKLSSQQLLLKSPLYRPNTKDFPNSLGNWRTPLSETCSLQLVLMRISAYSNLQRRPCRIPTLSTAPALTRASAICSISHRQALAAPTRYKTVITKFSTHWKTYRNGSRQTFPPLTRSPSMSLRLQTSETISLRARVSPIGSLNSQAWETTTITKESPSSRLIARLKRASYSR